MKKLYSQAQTLLERYCEAYKARDLAMIQRLFTQDCHVLGTGIDEYRVGLNALSVQHQRDWEQSQHGEIEIISSYSPSPNANWCIATCKARITINGVSGVFEPLRGTLTVEKEKGEWKISHMHASFPDVRNEPGDSFPTA